MTIDPNDLQRLEIAIRKRHDELADRVGATERWQQTFEAVNTERRAQSEAEFKRVHERLDRIDGHISRVVWLIVAAILGGVLTFVMQGGLNAAS